MKMPRIFVLLSMDACSYLGLRLLSIASASYQCFGIVEGELTHWTQYKDVGLCSIRNCYLVPDEEIKTLLALYRLSEDWIASIQVCGNLLQNTREVRHE